LLLQIDIQTLTPHLVYKKGSRKRIQQEKTIEELKKGERVNVKISALHIFLLRDGKYLSTPGLFTGFNWSNSSAGTVISIHPTPDLEYTSPITNRLRHRDTGLRATADPSLLVESLLDLGQSLAGVLALD
jgi:hypothetical protein